MSHESNDLSHHIDRFKGRRLVCIGDVMVDRFIYGDVRRISPEAPVPVVRITHEFSQLGGSGNVARNASSLGASISFFSVIGSDRAGREVTDLLGRHNAIESFLRVNAGRETTIKNRFFSSDGHHLLRADRETIAPLSEDDENDLSLALRREIEKADAVLLSDYGKGVVTPTFAKAVIAMAREFRKPVIVDPKGSDYSSYEGATVITPNQSELSLASNSNIQTEDEIISAAHALMDTHELTAVLVTRSAEGMSLIARGEDPHHLLAESHEVSDVTGAGDTVVAVLGLALASGLTLVDSARLANAAAGLVVMRQGTAVVGTSELAASLLRRDLSAAEAKVVDAATAATRAATWSAEGIRVGFTNGCFDLLHPGHVSLLAQAKAACDRLVVGLNSDASVGRLKGPDRPVQNEAARAAVIASMESVDLVVVFDHDTPLALIEAVNPSVLVKGADYAKDEVVGADIVEAAGGRVILADLVETFSTTATINAVKKE